MLSLRYLVNFFVMHIIQDLYYGTELPRPNKIKNLYGNFLHFSKTGELLYKENDDDILNPEQLRTVKESITKQDDKEKNMLLQALQAGEALDQLSNINSYFGPGFAYGTPHSIYRRSLRQRNSAKSSISKENRDLAEKCFFPDNRKNRNKNTLEQKEEQRTINTNIDTKERISVHRTKKYLTEKNLLPKDHRKKFLKKQNGDRCKDILSMNLNHFLKQKSKRDQYEAKSAREDLKESNLKKKSFLNNEMMISQAQLGIQPSQPLHVLGMENRQPVEKMIHFNPPVFNSLNTDVKTVVNPTHGDLAEIGNPNSKSIYNGILDLPEGESDEGHVGDLLKIDNNEGKMKVQRYQKKFKNINDGYENEDSFPDQNDDYKKEDEMNGESEDKEKVMDDVSVEQDENNGPSEDTPNEDAEGNYEKNI